MCTVCGCNANSTKDEKLISIEQDILHHNNQHAAQVRQHLDTKNIYALNFVSSPGAGKTTLLERTISDLKSEIVFSVIEGDQQTERDAQRIRQAGAKAQQINTGKGCHLDANMIQQAIETLSPPNDSMLLIENVGNLVCPAAFDLGEHHTVVILSVTEGDDKPLKYPDIFYAADIVIISKIDLLPYVEFDIEQCKSYLNRIKHHQQVLPLSATSGEGLAAWYDFLKNRP